MNLPKIKLPKLKLPSLPTRGKLKRANPAANTPAPAAREIIRPQAGPQETFLSSGADIAIYGGAAGGGKTWAALYEPLRHILNTAFEAVIFRRTRPQIKQAGGLLVESSKLYPRLGAICNLSELVWLFPSGMRVRFAQLQHEKSKFEWQGAQIALAIFDELTHFTESQFFYIVSRMRSTCGVRPYIRGTCNPDADSWIATFISWWIDQESGLPIIERSGKIRYFVRDGDKLLWGSSHEELRAQVPHWVDAQFKPKSVTFIAATVYDNPALLAADPDYLSNLMALPLVEREQLLGGNWKIKPAKGKVFKEHWFEVVDAPPAGAKLKTVRAWDFAGTKPKKGTDPDFTASVKISRDKDGVFYIEHAHRDRVSELEVQRLLVQTAKSDGRKVWVRFPRDPGQSGKFQATTFTSKLAGYDVGASNESGSKYERARWASAQAEAGNIKIVAGNWNKEFLSELAQFPDGKHDDFVDALSRAFNELLRDAESGGFGSC